MKTLRLVQVQMISGFFPKSLACSHIDDVADVRQNLSLNGLL